ncbi:ABC transporter permease [Trichocoleus sp. FACHB-262]|uniref:ABC transporter permease n=1 Tax=Trichocoleus sp. FACHB-262 TaxID=2692869 RepID=UPI001686B658|nr:ABC transporter permease [Trichocoleus sp. FACHB-262]MBD2120598.1 ABC transporter permease [Trichocoleus sp. FACHB-262]
MSSSSSSKRSSKTTWLSSLSGFVSQLQSQSQRSQRSARLPFPTGKVLRQCLSLVLFFGIWQLLCMAKFNFFVSFEFLPSPLEVFHATVEFFTGNAMVHIQASAIRVLVGFSVATILGVSLGILIGWFQKLEDLIFLPLEILRPIPAVAWIPLAILMFPTSEAGMIYITFLGAFFPILISTIRGVEGTDVILLRVGQCLGAKQWHIFKDIVVPGAMPCIASGLVIGMGNSWFCLVTAEILAGRYGVGYITWESYVTSNYPPIVMGMLLIGLMGLFSTYLVDRLTGLLMPWRITQKQRT